VAGGCVAGGCVAVGTTGAGVGVAEAHAERIVESTRIQATATVRVVLVLEGFICILLLTENGLSSETKLPSEPVPDSFVLEPARDY
jgi:hypothetical protein